MQRVAAVVIGAGQTGLAMSRCLSELSIEHVLLERGEVANSWRKERWDSLRLLTPNWLNRLPGYRYQGDDPDGYMTMPEIVDYIATYAGAIDGQFGPATLAALKGLQTWANVPASGVVDDVTWFVWMTPGSAQQLTLEAACGLLRNLP